MSGLKRYSTRVPAWALPLAALLLLVAAPALGVDAVTLRQVVLIATLSLIVSGFNLAFGYGGELAVGQIAMYGVGAYVGGILLLHKVDLAICLVAAFAAAMLLGLLTAVPGLRLSGWGLAMASFFLIVLIPDLTDIFKSWTGGLVGLTGIPNARVFGHRLQGDEFYFVVIGVTALWFAAMRNLVLSRHGAALQVLRQSPILAESLGISVYRLKLAAYALGSAPAGLAGCLLAARDRFVAPEYFTLEAAISVIAASILGGSQSIYGAILGAAILIIGPSQSTLFSQYAYIAYGVILLGGIFISKALSWLWTRLDRLLREPPSALSPPVLREAAASSELVLHGQALRLDGVVKRFTGLTALNGVSIEAAPGTVTGLIGANGSGKTTALNVVTGFYRADRGLVEVGGRLVTGLPSYRIARLGVARTFQTPLIPDKLTTLEVVASGRYEHDYAGLVSTILRLPGFRAVRRRDLVSAYRVLRMLGLSDLAERNAASLPLGSRRLVEVARAIAANPGVLLLDEPASGLDEGETRRLSEVIRRVRDAGATVVLIEHNFAMVCDVADHIYALDFGVLIASGTPDAIRSNEDVIRSYLGARREEGAA